MSKMVEFTSLKRKEVRAIIPNGEFPIEIKNPTSEQKEEILEMLTRNYDMEEKSLNLTDREVLTQLIPMLTNIHLDVEDKELMDEILDDPSDVLLDVQEVLADIVRGVTKRFLKVLEQLERLPDYELQSMMKKGFEKRVIQLSEAMDKEAKEE